MLVLNILREVEKDIPGLTDTTTPRRLGPKRANNIRKEEAVRQFVGERPLPEEDGMQTKFKSTRSIVLSRRWCWSARDLVWPSRSVALSSVRVYEGAGPAPLEHICRRTGPLISESRSSVGSEEEKNKAIVKAADKVTEATKKRDKAKTAKKSETGKKAVTGDKKEKKIAKNNGVVGAKKRRNRRSKEVRFGLAVFVI